MPLMLQENFTVKLLEMLRTGELDCAILAEPFPDTGLAIAPLYDEPFMAAVPTQPPAGQAQACQRRGAEAARPCCCSAPATASATMCSRSAPSSRALPANAEGIRKSFEGCSLETIKYMVASGMGVTVVPQLSVAPRTAQPHVRLHPVRAAGADAPRGAGLAAQLHALRGHRGAAQRVYACELPGVKLLRE